MWLVTRSAHYYPCPGTDDWLFASTNEDEARGYYAMTVPDSHSSVYLIRLTLLDGGRGVVVYKEVESK